MGSTVRYRSVAGDLKLDEMEHARASVAACLSLRPDFSIRHFMSKEPLKKPADAEQIASSLRLAGLPD